MTDATQAKLAALLNEAAGQIRWLSECLTNLSEGMDDPEERHDPSEDEQLLERIGKQIATLVNPPALTDEEPINQPLRDAMLSSLASSENYVGASYEFRDEAGALVATADIAMVKPGALTPSEKLEQAEARVSQLEEFAREIIKQYPNPDISHQDFRAHACRNAEAVLQQDQPASPNPCKGNCKTWIGNRTTGHIQCADCGRPKP